MHDARYIPFITSLNIISDSLRKDKQAQVSGATTNANVGTVEQQSEANYLSLGIQVHTLIMLTTGPHMIIVLQKPKSKTPAPLLYITKISLN